MSRHPVPKLPDGIPNREGHPLRDIDTSADKVDVISDEEAPEQMLAPPDDINRSKVVADATAKNKAAPEPTKPVTYARVIRGGPVLENGFRTQLKEGKIVDSLNYNLKRLQQQGIRLEKCDKEEQTFVE